MSSSAARVRRATGHVRFLAVGPFATRETRMFLGMGVLLGYRWVTRSGLVLEPGVGYEYFAGRRPLVAGSRDLQEELGVTVGLAIGWAW